MGSIVAGFVFKKYFTSSSQKLSYLTFFTVLLSVTSILPIYSSTFVALITVISIRNFCSQMLETPCQGIYIYTLGCKKSQPFVMVFHCTVGIGFLLGPLVIGPFFPDNPGQNGSERVCNFTRNSESENNLNRIDDVMENIQWPYWIVLIGHLVCGIFYILLIHLPYEMPGKMIKKNILAFFLLQISPQEQIPSLHTYVMNQSLIFICSS